MRGTLEIRRFTGAALEGNALGDPAARELHVYLPPSYADASRRYPVLMFLSGYGSTGASYFNFRPWEPSLINRYERLLAQGCPEAILVMPDCFTRLGGSQYLDSPAIGAYQRYLAEDVVGFLDASYRTLAQPGSRALVGKSSGGFGALRMGLDRPGVFVAYASHAGDCAFELSIRPRFVDVSIAFNRAGGMHALAQRVAEQGPPRGQSEFLALEFIAFAAAYAPIADGPHPRGALPFDPATAQVIPEIWSRWLANDPLEQAKLGPRGLSFARLVFLDAGKWDEYGLGFGARILAEALRNHGVHVHHEEFEGGHMGTSHRYEVSIPTLLASLDLH